MKHKKMAFVVELLVVEEEASKERFMSIGLRDETTSPALAFVGPPIKNQKGKSPKGPSPRVYSDQPRLPFIS